MAEFQSTRNADVAMCENQLSQDFDVRPQAQSQRIDTVNESVQKIERDFVDNTKSYMIYLLGWRIWGKV